MSDKFLNGSGLTNLWNKIKTLVATKQNLLPKGTLENTDLDTVKTVGHYWTTNTGITNAPSGLTSTYGVLEVLSAGSGIYQQVFYAYNNTALSSTYYTRMFVNSQWYDWVKIATSSDLRNTGVSTGRNLDATVSSSIDAYGEVYRSYNLYTDFSDSFNQYVTSTDVPSVSVPNATYTTLKSFSLSKGLYHIEAAAQFDQNSSGWRRLDLTSKSNSTETSGASYYLASSTAAACGGAMCLHVSVFLKVESTTTYYLRAYQYTSPAATLTVSPRIQILKLND